MRREKNRWLIALSGVAIHLSIGSAYAWSVFKEPIGELTGWDKSSISFAFSLAIFCLGTSAAFMGKFVEKFGPRKTGTVASILFGLGIVSTGFAVSSQSLPMLYLTYGIIGGIGLGAGYVTPVSTMIRWFPDRKGLATGLAIMGFGFASMITGPIAQQLMVHVGVSRTFYILGIAYFLVMFTASRYLEKPPVGWTPEGFEAPNPKEEVKVQYRGVQLTANQAIKTKTFWFMVYAISKYYLRDLACFRSFTNGARNYRYDSWNGGYDGGCHGCLQWLRPSGLGINIRCSWSKKCLYDSFCDRYCGLVESLCGKLSVAVCRVDLFANDLLRCRVLDRSGLYRRRLRFKGSRSDSRLYLNCVGRGRNVWTDLLREGH